MAVMTGSEPAKYSFAGPERARSVQEQENKWLAGMLIPALERWMESNLSLNTLVHGNAENLAGRCRTEVRDVEVAVRADGHTGRNGEAGGYIFNVAGAIKAYDLAITRSWEAGSGRELERIEETIRAEIDGDNCGEAGARSRGEILRLSFTMQLGISSKR
jgi:hypothetical protein